MEQDGAWGDHLILCAAANCFETCIHVVSSLHNDVVIRPHSLVDESKPLVLGHIHEVHYVSLQPIQGKKRKKQKSRAFQLEKISINYPYQLLSIAQFKNRMFFLRKALTMT